VGEAHRPPHPPVCNATETTSDSGRYRVVRIRGR
jgi:hypothetical protein